jgi:hypothetical protein
MECIASGPNEGAKAVDQFEAVAKGHDFTACKKARRGGALYQGTSLLVPQGQQNESGL